MNSTEKIVVKFENDGGVFITNKEEKWHGKH